MNACRDELEDALTHEADWIDAVIIALCIGVALGWLLGGLAA